MSQPITLVPRACDPIALHAWDVQSANGGSGGVTDSEDSAIDHVTHALRTGEPGARGLIRKVALAASGAPHYVELRTAVEAWLDETSGSIVLVG